MQRAVQSCDKYHLSVYEYLVHFINRKVYHSFVEFGFLRYMIERLRIAHRELVESHSVVQISPEFLLSCRLARQSFWAGQWLFS